MFLLSLFLVDIFLGGYSNLWFTIVNLSGYILKVLMMSALFVILRASLPRYRYDQLMLIGWEVILPFAFGYILFLAGILFYFSGEIVRESIVFSIF